MKNVFGAIGKELSQIFIGMGKGLSFIFVETPKKLFKKKEVTRELAEVTVNPNAITLNKKTLYGRLVEKIENWYNNLPSVKAKKEQLEASLVPLVLDPDGRDAIKNPIKQMYKYVAKNQDGKIIEGYFAAFSKLDVYSYLTDEKMTIYQIETNKTINFVHGSSSSFNSKMKTKDLVFWLAQLSTYVKAGIPLTDAVKVLAQQDKRAKYKSIYESVIYELTMGQTFSEALFRQGNAFPALLVNMIKSAEMTGSIEETLDEMSEYYQEIEETKRAVISALAYPSIVMIFAGVVVVFMLTYIVPKFVSVYDSMNSEIPKITQITLDISAFLRTKYYYIIIFLVVFIVSYTLLFKKVKAFKAFMQSIAMKLPVIGPLLIAKEMGMFARTFASLQKNNVLLTDSIDVLAKITSNEIYKELELRTIENLIKGNKMSETFKDHWAIPDIAYFMIVTGESTGELAEMLDRVADFYQQQEKNSVAMVKTFIEPVMILFLAIVVGFILIAILVPMFGIYGVVS